MTFQACLGSASSRAFVAAGIVAWLFLCSASETKPAKLLAVFVVDTNEMELTIPFGN